MSTGVRAFSQRKRTSSPGCKPRRDRSEKQTFRDAERRGPPTPHLVRNHTRPRATKSTRVVVPRAARNAARSGGDTACARTPPPSRVRARRSSRRSRNPPVVIADDHPRGGDGRRRRDRGGGPARRRRCARRRREGTTRSVPCFVVRGGPSGSPRKRARGGVLPRGGESPSQSPLVTLRFARRAFAS